MQPASKARQLLAIYVDYVLFFTVFKQLGLIVYWLAVPAAVVFGFIVLESVLLPRGWSAGCYLLSLQAEWSAGRRVLVVDDAIKAGESKLTLLMGLWFIVDATRLMSRWIVWQPSLPIFGIRLREVDTAFVSMLLGVVSLYLGVGWLRLKRQVRFATVLFLVASVVSVAMSRDYWGTYAEEWVIQRQQFFGMSPDAGRIVFLQSLMPEIIYAGLGLQALGLLLSWRRLRF
jgi:hypothetical protein